MKSSDWISVGYRLPNATYRERGCELSDVVLLCLQENAILTAVLVKKDGETAFWASTLGGYTYPVWLATHWQPVVLPKKEKE